ncbi:putative Endonuclease-reverse transcriptase [Trypanosoma cruzi]|nr:putative Endonuclease-reverse transcriptase [Trypanosoma cruzi]
MVKHLTVSDWSASVSPLSDHYMLTFTLHQAFKDTIPSAPPSAPKTFYSWGKCKWDLFIKDFDAQLPAYDYKSSPPALKLSRERLLLRIDDIAPAACTRMVPGFGTTLSWRQSGLLPTARPAIYSYRRPTVRQKCNGQGVNSSSYFESACVTRIYVASAS